MKIVMLNANTPNPRRRKRLRLEKELADVTLVCWERRGNPITEEEAEGCRTIVCHIPTAPGIAVNPLARLKPQREFTLAAEKEILAIAPDIIHAENLDMLRIACRIRKKSGNKIAVLYEIPDLHTVLVDKPTSPLKWLMQRYLRREDRRCCREIDKLIVTSPHFYDYYFSHFVPQEKVMFLPNMPDISVFANYRKKDEATPFTVGFVGQMHYIRQMENLLESCRALDMPLLMAGFEADGSGEYEKKCRTYEKCEWIGRFDLRKQAAELYGKCDAVFLVYDADRVNVRHLLPNKLYEAILCELPIIVARGTYLAEIVEEMGIGVAVDHHNREELQIVLARMRAEPDWRRKMAENCRKNKHLIDASLYNEPLLQYLEQKAAEVDKKENA